MPNKWSKPMERRFQKISALMIILLLFTACSSSETVKPEVLQTATPLVIQNSSEKTFTLSQLEEDFEQFKGIIERLHPKLYADKEALAALFENQHALLKENMNESEFFRALSPIAAKLNCGHTSISYSKEYEDWTYETGKFLPLDIKVIGDKAYVYRTLLSGIPVGSEIISINSQTAKEIINLFLDNITADGENTSKKIYIMNLAFSDLYFKFVGSPEKFVIAYQAPSSQEVIETTLASSMKAQIAASEKDSLTTGQQDSPMYIEAFEEDFAVLTIKSFAYYDDASRNEFKSFIDGFFTKVKDKNIEKIILDLRDNWGGDPYCSSHLYSYLIQEAHPYFSKKNQNSYYAVLQHDIEPAVNKFEGQLITLINGASFSSTGHLCALLKYHKIGVFVGEESGGSYICTDSSTDAVLKHTKLRFHYSTAAWQVEVSGLTPGRGIIPDHAITLTIRDYLDNRDTVKEYAVELIKKGNP